MDVLTVCLFFCFRLVSCGSLDKHDFLSSRDGVAQPCYNAPRSHSLCGQQGSLTNPSRLTKLGNFTTPSIPFCRAACISTRGSCVSLSWDSSTNECVLFNRKLKNQGLVAGAGDVTYWDYNCFKCLDDCPLGENLFFNPGFEQYSKDTLPWYFVTYYGTLVTPGHNSTTAIGNIKPKSQEASYSTIEYYLVRCPGFYQLSFDYKISVSRTLAFPAYVQANSDPTTVFWNPSKNNTWSRFYTVYDSRYKHNEIVHTDISMNLYNEEEPYSGDITVDNINLHRINKPVAVSGARNLVSNPGFESGNLTSYQNSTLCEVVSPGYESSHAARCTARPADFLFSSNVSTTEQTTYIGSFDYKIITYHHTMHCRLYFDLGGPFWQSDNYVAEVGRPYGSLPNDTWTHF